MSDQFIPEPGHSPRTPSADCGRCVAARAIGACSARDLSISEFLLVKEAGFDPVGLVIGSSIYHIGVQIANYRQNQELQVLSQAMYQARELAMSRMEEEADALGADGIVGVRLDINRYEWGQGLAEFMAVGTAVRSQTGTMRTPQNKPFTSDLSGQDFWTLLQAGYAPLALVMGSCVYHVAHQRLQGQWMRTASARTRRCPTSPRPSTTPRARHGADADRGRGGLSRGHRGSPDPREQSRLGQPRHRVLRSGHRGQTHQGGSPHRAAPDGAVAGPVIGGMG